MKMTALSDLVGLDEPVSPARMQFTSRPTASDTCAGCIFRNQRSEVCKEATRVALLADLPDCDDGHVYVAVVTDPRQMSIIN